MELESSLLLINEQVRSLKAYHLEPEETRVKLNQNENPWDWPFEVKKEIADFVLERPWNRYPDFIPSKLKEELAAYAGVKPAQVIAGNGSNEMLLVLMMSFVKPGTVVITCQPTFTLYQLLSRGLGASPLPVALDKELRFDVDALVAAVRSNPGSVLIVCTPNNPTGSTLEKQDLVRILDAHRGICIIDQAYVEFGGYDAVPLLERYANVIVTRTFSKAFAGAGLRIGYLLGNASVVAELNKIKLPYNINFFSDHVARVLLRERAIGAETVNRIVRERAALYSFIQSLPFDKVYPSMANFILVRTGDMRRLFDFLKKKGILVRDVSSYPMLENCMRISVGSPDENDALKKALTAFFA